MIKIPHHSAYGSGSPPVGHQISEEGAEEYTKVKKLFINKKTIKTYIY